MVAPEKLMIGRGNRRVIGRTAAPGPTRLLLAILLSIVLTDCGCRPTGQAPPASGADAGTVTLTSLGWWQGEEPITIDAIIAQFTQETGISVKLITIRESTAEGLAQYLELLKNQSSPPDVFSIDTIWTGILAEHMIDLTPHLAPEASTHLAAAIGNNTVDGRLVAMPFFADVGLLFYRTDLLQQYGFRAPPESWDELERMAARIQAGERARGRKGFWGYVWEGADYEGLTCNALEWQVSHGGGRVVEADGRITVNNPQALRALKRAAAWVGTISPPGVTAYREEDARNVWQSGNAAFMRNWPYTYGLGQMAASAIKGRFDVTLLPSGGAQPTGALGGWQLAVSRQSTHRREAIEFVRYMTSRRVQSQRAVAVSYLPTIPALYDDPQVLAANPYYGRLKGVLLGGALSRPSAVTGRSYNDVSAAYSSAVHSVLTGEVAAEAALAGLETRIAAITGLRPGAP